MEMFFFLVVTGSNSVFTIVGTFMISKSNKHGHALNAVFCCLCFFSFTLLASIFGEACLTIAWQTPAEIRKSQLFWNSFLNYSISLRVIPCFILQRNDADKEVFVMEEALTGSFKKYLVNDGNATKNGLETSDGFRNLVHRIHNMDSRIQDCLEL